MVAPSFELLKENGRSQRGQLQVFPNAASLFSCKGAQDIPTRLWLQIMDLSLTPPKNAGQRKTKDTFETQRLYHRDNYVGVSFG